MCVPLAGLPRPSPPCPRPTEAAAHQHGEGEADCGGLTAAPITTGIRAQTGCPSPCDPSLPSHSAPSCVLLYVYDVPLRCVSQRCTVYTWPQSCQACLSRFCSSDIYQNNQHQQNWGETDDMCKEILMAWLSSLTHKLQYKKMGQISVERPSHPGKLFQL